MEKISEQLKIYANETIEQLEKGILRFWLDNGIDGEYGGYLTCFDENGRPQPDMDKLIVTQTRMIWGFSALAERYPERTELIPAARQGFEFFLKHFWDREHEGWFWKTDRQGKLLDGGKVVYGQSFAIYALARYYSSTKDIRGLDYAEKTFDLLEKYCADNQRGGYYENLERVWSLSAGGFCAGDRKSLDIHMHIMEALTGLYKVSGKEIHRRRLDEVINIILSRMIDPETGCGFNQFDLDFNPIPAINIRRTWNAEREMGEIIASPKDTTSYGHNLELNWLLNRAAAVMGIDADRYKDICIKMADHALAYGLDYTYGGVYRDGPHIGEPMVKDKEWWQNAEALVGFLDAYERTGDRKYLSAYENIWDFVKGHMINPIAGEWRQLLNREGAVIAGNMGNQWKGIYHTGRAMLECAERLERLL